MLVPIVIVLLLSIHDPVGAELTCRSVEYPITCYSCSWADEDSDNTISCVNPGPTTPTVDCDGSCYYQSTAGNVERGCTWYKPYDCSLHYQGCCSHDQCNDQPYVAKPTDKWTECFQCSFDSDPEKKQVDIEACKNPKKNSTRTAGCRGTCATRIMDYGHRSNYHRYCEEEVCSPKTDSIYGISYITQCCSDSHCIGITQKVKGDCSKSSSVKTTSSVSLLLISVLLFFV